MTEAEARKWIERAVAWDSAPALTVLEVDDLVLLARRPDEDGREPGDVDWIETYDVRSATSTGWEWKLAKVVGKFDFSGDGVSVNRSTMIRNIEAMIDRYRGGGNKALRSVGLTTKATPVGIPYPEQIP